MNHAAPDAAPAERAFHWRNSWYPVAFVEDLPRDRPTAFSIHDVRFVLFLDGEGTLGCLHDRSPHRAARLSDGQLTDGRLEYIYHGWQFDAGGRCVSIPQIPHGSEIPARACAASYTAVERAGDRLGRPGETGHEA